MNKTKQMENILSYQEQYISILNKLIHTPHKSVPTRVGNARSRFFETIRIDLQKEFPLMELKKLNFNNILHELLWFISGNTNIKYLVDNNCNIWNEDAHKYFKRKYQSNISLEDFIEKVKQGEKISSEFYTFGDLDCIYGHNWRNFDYTTDQLINLIHTLKNDPHNRRTIVTSLNPSEMSRDMVGLPACHNMFQVYTSPIPLDERLKILENKYAEPRGGDHEYLDNLNIPKYYVNLWHNIRSNDWGLGQPYNTPSYAILLHIIGKITNMVPKKLYSSIIDCHLYEEHVEPIKTLIERFSTIKNSFCSSNILIHKKSDNIDDYKFEDFELINYKPHSAVKMRLLT